MVDCPNCKKEIENPQKTWNYWKFTVEAYCCDRCGARFRDYSKEGKHSFTLKFEDGKWGMKKI